MKCRKRKPLSVEHDNTTKEYSQTTPKVANLLRSLSTFLQKYQCVLLSIRECCVILTKLAAYITSTASQHPLNSSSREALCRDLEARWLAVLHEFTLIIDSRHTVDIVDLGSNEFEVFEHILDQVHEKPPSATTLLKDHRKPFLLLTSSST
jgi:hypothetical protein